MKSKNSILALCGAIVGGFLGYLIYGWGLRQGFSVLVAPGAFVGFGAGAVKCKSVAIPILCGIAGLALGIFAEWRGFPFIADDSLSYFLLHVYQLKLIPLLSIVIGAAIAFWVPFRHRGVLPN